MPPDAAKEACATVEVCGDGRDNDCDGAVDCEDADCNAFQCAPLPDGWAPIAYAPTRETTCPEEFGAPGDTEEGAIDNPVQCSCDCRKDTGATCSPGQLTLRTGTACQANSVALSTTSNCGRFASPLRGEANTRFSVDRVVPQQGQCSGTPRQTGSGTRGSQLSRTCNVPRGQGCADGKTCIPRPVAPFAMCVVATSNQVACPPDYPIVHRLSDPPRDERSCGPCTCAMNARCSSRVRIYERNDCTADMNNLVTEVNNVDQCDLYAFPASTDLRSYDIRLRVADDTCSVTAPSQLVGAVVRTNQRLVCCQ
jgi:hypothetical protein